MSCKYLLNFRICRCTASDHLFYPSVWEMVEFCNGDFEKCPIYRNPKADLKKEMEIARGEAETKTAKVG